MANGNIGSTYTDYGYWKFKPSNYSVCTTSKLIKATDGILRGLFVSAGTPTIKIWNNTTAATTSLIETFTTVAGTSYDFYDTYFSTGCYLTMTGAGTATVFYK